MQQQHLTVPRHVRFADLGLSREPVTDNVSCTRSALEAFCRSNGLDSTVFVGNDEVAGWMIAQWYRLHRERGGEPDTVAETLLHERHSSRRLSD